MSSCKPHIETEGKYILFKLKLVNTNILLVTRGPTC